MSPNNRRICFVASTTLLLSTLEYIIPKPLPFLKLGLANLPLLVILDTFTFKEFLLVALLKAIGQATVNGTLFSYLFLISFFGTLASALSMKSLKHILRERISLVGCSIFGAFCSNLMQLWVADKVAYGNAIWVAAPLLLSVGLSSSIILGFIAIAYKKHSSLALDQLLISEPPQQAMDSHRMVFFLLLLDILAIILEKRIIILLLCSLLLYGAQYLSGRKIRILPPLLLLVSLIILSLFEPSGKELLPVGRLAFTVDALLSALTKGFRLLSLLSCSQTMVATHPRFKGKLFDMVSMTLGYFSSFTIPKNGGTFFEKVDATLLSALKGTPKNQKPMKVYPVAVFAIVTIGLTIFF